MSIKKIVLMSTFALSFLSCRNDDKTIYNITVEDIYRKTNIYPQPPEQWMGGNDPYFTSGYVADVMPYYENGTFNLFFLHDAKNKPAGKGYHDIHLFETKDFVNYSYDGRMIPYGTTDEPDFGVGTGSMVKAGNTYYYYYTGNNGIASFLQNNPRESVLLAKSTDMKNWTKVSNFKITAPAGYYNFEFRDPHVFFNSDENKYWMLVSAQTDDRKAVILKFSTSDPSTNNWVADGPIYTTTAQENYLMMECADEFKMGNYWYLVFSENWSENRGTHYRYATSPSGPWITPENDRLDGSYLYAAKTVSDGPNRYYVGWSARNSPETNGGDKEFGGNLVAHQLVQNSDGTLGVKQIQSMASVFGNNTALNIVSKSGNVSQSGNNFTVGNSSLVTFENLKKANSISFDLKTTSTGSTGIILAQDAVAKSGVKIAFEPESNRLATYNVTSGTDNLVNKLPFTFVSGQTYRVSVSISNDVCVVYINDKIAFTNRVYNVNQQKWSIFGNNDSTYSNLTLKNP